jgi:hypothetical protein
MRIMREPWDTCAQKPEKASPNGQEGLQTGRNARKFTQMQSLHSRVWAARFFEIGDRDSFEEQFFNGLLRT